jgi:hypothetical protein
VEFPRARATVATIPAAAVGACVLALLGPGSAALRSAGSGRVERSDGRSPHASVFDREDVRGDDSPQLWVLNGPRLRLWGAPLPQSGAFSTFKDAVIGRRVSHESDEKGGHDHESSEPDGDDPGVFVDVGAQSAAGSARGA